MKSHKGYKKLFNDKEKLDLLINLRLEGYSISSLATIFHCDKVAIRHQCDKYGIYPQDMHNPWMNSFSVSSVVASVLGVKPRSYKDYLAKAGYK